MATYLIPYPQGKNASFYANLPDSLVKFLAPGVYQARQDQNGTVYYMPLEADNDKPLEVSGIIGAVVTELRDFMTREEAFKQFGFSHKRGYLLHGPPGCGKTSALRLLQGRFVTEFNGIVLVWEDGYQGSAIRTFLDDVQSHNPGQAVMVVKEDIDQAAHDFETDILELLDGQRALKNFVLVATTNNLDVIPDRIKNRPSRIDRLVEIPLPDLAARQMYLIKIGVTAEMAVKMADASEGLSMAHLKELVIGHLCLGQDLDTVVERVRDMSPDTAAPRSTLKGLFGSALRRPTPGVPYDDGRDWEKD
jgi:hypothetical protein